MNVIVCISRGSFIAGEQIRVENIHCEAPDSGPDSFGPQDVVMSSPVFLDEGSGKVCKRGSNERKFVGRLVDITD